MSLTAKASFVIERNLEGDLSLESVATACGVSRFHLAHAFASATGKTVTGYIRGRRLTQAACALSCGSPNILDVAICAGYASHEAFSRAFRARFNVTPEELRKRGTLDGLPLEETLAVKAKQTVSLAAPQIKKAGELLFVGLAAPRHMADGAKIAGQWRSFMSGPYHQIANKRELPPVGVTLPGEAEEEFVYVCAAQVY